jgi:hypothetical protein
MAGAARSAAVILPPVASLRMIPRFPVTAAMPTPGASTWLLTNRNVCGAIAGDSSHLYWAELDPSAI